MYFNDPRIVAQDEANGAERAAGDARDKAARAINLGRTTAERLGKILAKADAGQQRAQKIVAEMDAGSISIAAGYKTLFEDKPVANKPADCPRCHETSPSMNQLRKHWRKVHKEETQLLYKELGFDHATGRVGESRKPSQDPLSTKLLKAVSLNNVVVAMQELVTGLKESEGFQYVCPQKMGMNVGRKTEAWGYTKEVIKTLQHQLLTLLKELQEYPADLERLDAIERELRALKNTDRLPPELGRFVTKKDRSEPEPLAPQHQEPATPDELKAYTDKFPNGLLDNAKKFVSEWREFSEDELVSALVNLQYKPAMARAAVRYVKSPEVQRDLLARMHVGRAHEFSV